MNREEMVLAAMSPAKGASFSPVQVQKLFFLIDKNIAEEVDGPYFDFQPYSYGPYDKAVYHTLESLADTGDISINVEGRYKSYRLTVDGQQHGEEILDGLPVHIQTYLTRLSDFVRSLTFTQLVTAIYKAYPEMRQNSIFQG